MSSPIRPEIPGTPIKKLSPFVTDTLFKIAGGAFPIRRSRGFSPLGPDNEALTRAPLRPNQGDTAVVFYKDPRDPVLAHETGHIIDHRNIAPDVLGNVAAGRDKYKNQRDYFGSNRDEYVAEAVARAIESGRRHQFSDSTKVDKEMPGAISAIRWLLTRPPFNDSNDIAKNLGKLRKDGKF